MQVLDLLGLEVHEVKGHELVKQLLHNTVILGLSLSFYHSYQCMHTEDAHGSDRENFFKEMKMMKMVSSSDNEMKQFVVNMVGCITVKEPLLLVVEYVRHGDLQRFLRTIKRQVN